MSENQNQGGTWSVTLQVPFDLYAWVKARGKAQTRKPGPQIIHILREVKMAEDE